jgi:hypothetical protein
MKELFRCYPALLTYRKDSLSPRADGKLTADYQTINRAPTDEDFEQHLRGEISLGVSPLCDDDTVTWGVIDLDMYPMKRENLVAIINVLKGSFCAVFRSKSNGLHIYMFTVEPVPAAEMVDVLKALRDRFPRNYREKAKEIFPRQTTCEGLKKNPNCINLPGFGNTRELVALIAGEDITKGGDRHETRFVFDLIKDRLLITDDDWQKLVERARAKVRSKNVISTPVGFREPSDAPGRQEFLFKCGASMRARGADMDKIRKQLFELDDHYAEIDHPLWVGKGPIDPKRIESALKQIAEYEQGTPSGLTYQKVAEFNEEFALINFDGKIEVINKATCDFSTWPWGEFVKWVKPRRVKIGNKYIELAPLWLADIDRHQYQTCSSWDRDELESGRGMSAYPPKADVAAVGRESPMLTQAV